MPEHIRSDSRIYRLLRNLEAGEMGDFPSSTELLVHHIIQPEGGSPSKRARKRKGSRKGKAQRRRQHQMITQRKRMSRALRS